MTKIETLHENDWLSLKKMDDWYVFSHETRSMGHLVALLVYDGDKILGRWEVCPPHMDGMALTTITGGVEKEGFIPSALEELWEEAGYRAVESELIHLGTSNPSKSADTVMHYFGFDAAGRDRRPGKSVGDGSKGEEGAYCDWIDKKDAIWCKDPHMAVMLSRLETL